jgi:hypothetical protein
MDKSMGTVVTVTTETTKHLQKRRNHLCTKTKNVADNNLM